jgi:hypothetical protein
MNNIVQTQSCEEDSRLHSLRREKLKSHSHVNIIPSYDVFTRQTVQETASPPLSR